MYKQEHLATLKQYISSRGDTQTTLAKALGMSRLTLSRKLNEDNGQELTAIEMQAICEHYGIPLEQRTALFFEAR